MASLNRYFTLFIASITLLNLPVFSQQKGYALQNLITSTNLAQATLAQNNLQRANTFNFQKTSHQEFDQNQLNNTLIVEDCGEGTSAETPTPSGSNVSPNTQVLNPQLAYDQDQSSYSTLYIDLQEKDVELAQYILFSAPASASYEVKLTLSLLEELLNSNDFTVSIQGYNGTTAVGTAVEITSQLPLYSTTKDFTLTPGAEFDRVKINVRATQNGQKKAKINVHYVRLIPPVPVFPGSTSTNGVTSSTSSLCEGAVTLQVNNPDPALIYKWYNSSNVFLTTGSSYSPSNLAVGNHVFYVSAAKGTTCPESAKHQINLTVNAKPASPIIAITN